MECLAFFLLANHCTPLQCVAPMHGWQLFTCVSRQLWSHHNIPFEMMCCMLELSCAGLFSCEVSLCSEDVKLCTSLCCFALPEYWHMFLYFRIKEFIFLSWVSKVEQNCLESTDRSAIKLFGVRGVHAWAYGISKPCMVPKLDLLYLCCHCIRRKLLISAFWLQDASWGCRKRNAGLSILKDPF